MILAARAGVGAEPEELPRSSVMKPASGLRSAFRFHSVELDGPTEAAVGRLVVLDSSAIPATARSWVLLNPPRDDNHQISSDGERFFFSTATPGAYWVVFAFGREAEAEAGGAVEVVQVPHRLVIGAPDDIPDPDDPTPDPVPPRPKVPDGRFQLAAVAHASAISISSSLRSRAKAVGGVYRTVASKVAAGALTIDDGLDELQKRLRSTLGDDFDGWKPWGRAVMTEVKALFDGGKITTAADVAEAFSEIADGLEVVP